MKKSTDIALTLAFMSIPFVAGFVGCTTSCALQAKPQPLPPMIDAGAGLTACAASVAAPPQSAVCDGVMTARSMGCYRCAVSTPCLYTSAMVYCVAACSDCAK